MRAAGIIAEFNPFHNGHEYLVSMARNSGADVVAAVMSGNFVQRGGCAIADKFTRAKAAVMSGVDIVFEMPQPFALGSAERFARAGISILDSCGCIDTLVFGSECGDITLLKSAADVDILDSVSLLMKHGLSYPKAVRQALSDELGQENAEKISAPNDMLAIEYIKAIKYYNSNIEPVCIKRKGAEHDSDISCGQFASASMIRDIMKKGGGDFSAYIPNNTIPLWNEAFDLGRCPADMTYNERGVLAILRCMSADEIARLPDVSEGLEHRIYNAVRRSVSLDEVISHAVCGRYTAARVRRLITCAYLGITSDTARSAASYIRVLAYNNNGIEILRTMKKTSRLPILMKARDLKNISCSLLDTDLRAGDLYALCLQAAAKCGDDYYIGAVRV